MGTVAETAARLQEEMQRQNPAAKDGNAPAEARTRVPMTAPTRRMELPQIPGYYVQWIRGTNDRLQQALNAGFEFIRPGEVHLNNRLLGDDVLKSGNTDLGDRVSIGDGTDEQGHVIRSYAMKQREDYHAEDMAVRQRGNDSIADSLTAAFQHGRGSLPAGEGRAPSENGVDAQQRYVDRSRTKIPTLFQRKR